MVHVFDDGEGGHTEVQRTMFEIVNWLDGFDAQENIKVIMETNRLVGNQSMYQDFVQWILVLFIHWPIRLN